MDYRLRRCHAYQDHRETAVVQGTVLAGIEKSPSLVKAKPFPKCYGIVWQETFSTARHHERDRYVDPATNRVMAQNQMIWLARKGDVVLSDDVPAEEQKLTYTFRDGATRKFRLPVYEYPNEDAPPRYYDAAEGLSCSMSP